MRKKLLEWNIRNVGLIVGMIVAFALAIAKSYYLANVIDRIASHTLTPTEIVPTLAGLLGIILLTVVAEVILVQFLPLRLALGRSIGYTKHVAHGMLGLSHKHYNRKDNGYYINLITSSAFTCGDLYAQLNVQLIGYALCVLILVVGAAIINAAIGLCFLIYIPLYALALKLPNQRISTFQKDGLSTQDTFLGETKKLVEHKRSINMARADDYFYRSYEKKADKYLDFVTRFRWYSILSANIPKVLSAFLLIGTMGISLTQYFRGDLDLTYLLLIFQLTQILQGPLDGFFQIWSYSSINEVHIERLDTFRQVQDEPSGFEPLYGEQTELVRIPHGTFFADSEREYPLFVTDDLVIPKKGLTLIKGKNGTGKSMLLNYLTGFSEAEKFEGNISIDRSLADVPYQTNPVLLVNGTLEENMFGQAIDPALLDILGIDITDKVIDDSAVNLSFGEQQKLNLLRTLSADSALYLLDEPFTNLDKETVKRLSDYLAKLSREKSVIAIVHSEDLDDAADRIVEIRDGATVLHERSAHA